MCVRVFVNAVQCCSLCTGSCCPSRVDVEDYLCKAGKVVSLLDKATMGASCSYWEAFKVDFALVTSDKKHLYVSRRRLVMVQVEVELC